LLQLSTPTSAPLMPLATPTADASLYEGGTGAGIAGWGLTVGGGSILPDTLQWATTVLQSQSSCENAANEEFDDAPFDTVDQMCAIDAPYYDEGTCEGDSGGPLVAVGPSGSLVEIGLTSWLQVDCDTTTPDFFTNVAALSGWLSHEITEMSPPSVTTSAPSNITTSSVTLNGTVNPNENATTYYFQYGLTTAYGSTIAGGTTNNGLGVLSVSSPITDLASGEIMHYRLVATNANGTSYGADQTFTTLTPPPPPPPPKPEAGTYRGKTSQHDPISIKVAANHAQVSGMMINFGLRCTRRHRRVTYVITPKGSYYWPRRITADGGLGFSDSFLDANNWRYKFKATFTTTGTVTGTMSVTAKHQRYGTCTSGTVRWSAKV
jgi:Trypsin